MKPDRRALNVLLAALEIEQRDLAEAMGYRSGYVANVLGGFTQASGAFKAAFGELVAELLLGPSRKGAETYPAGPLRELIERRAAEAGSRKQLFSALGLSSDGWNKRVSVTASLVDRVCCALGVHPTALYPDFVRLEEAS